MLGAILGVGGAIARGALAPEAASPSWAAAGGALAVSTATGAFLLLAAALLSFPLLAWRAGRVAAVLLSSAAGVVFAASHVGSSVVRALSGEFLSRGALDFVLGGGWHLLGTIAAGYWPFVMGLLSVAGLVAVALGLSTLRELRGAPRRVPHAAWLAAPVALALSAGAAVLSVPELMQHSPEAALAASLLPTPMEPPLDPSASGRAAETTAAVADGARLSERERWSIAVRNAPRPKANVLLLTLESLSIGHLGYFGYERPITPNLDRVAAKSLRLRRAWSTATHSNYAQMAILSSLFPRRSGGLDTYRRLDYPRVLLHDVFHELGHATATISSQDETWQGMLRFQQTGTPTHFRHSSDHKGPHIDIGSELVVQDQVTADLALEWIGQQGDRPFSIYVNFQSTHFPYRLARGTPAPYQPIDVTRGRFNYLGYPDHDRQAVVNRYDNAVRYLDEQVGRLERGLERLGKLDDTIWVITSDHGENFHDHGQVTHGRTLFDSEARVPLLIHWPAKLEPADELEPVSTLDILPTILDLMGLPPHPAFQGRSFASHSTDTAERPAIFMNIQGFKSADGIVCWPWKLIVDRGARTSHLFDLEHDPEELHDLAPREPDVAERLRGTLNAQMSAQLAYHRKGSAGLGEHFAPRLLSCPVLPETERADVESDALTRPVELPITPRAARPSRPN